MCALRNYVQDRIKTLGIYQGTVDEARRIGFKTSKRGILEPSHVTRLIHQTRCQRAVVKVVIFVLRYPW